MKKTIQIKGMNCGHCVKAIEKATAVKVSLEEKTAVIEFTNTVSDAKIKDAIECAGFKVMSIN